MQAFRRGTPYQWFNIYIGGVARACPQRFLNGSWVTAIRKQGWALLPTWVGPQPPCSLFVPHFSSNAAAAYHQGLEEAVSAYVALNRRGHNEIWNGVTLNVDSNGSDGPVDG